MEHNKDVEKLREALLCLREAYRDAIRAGKAWRDATKTLARAFNAAVTAEERCVTRSNDIALVRRLLALSAHFACLVEDWPDYENPEKLTEEAKVALARTRLDLRRLIKADGGFMRMRKC